MSRTRSRSGKQIKKDPATNGEKTGSRPAFKIGIPVVAIIALVLTYKYQGSEDLRNNLYRPLYSEISQIRNAIQQNHIYVSFQTSVKSDLEDKGEINRLPMRLRNQVRQAYADAASLIGNMPVEEVERVTSIQVERIRTKEQDDQWLKKTVNEMNAELMSKPGESAIRSFEFKHAGTSPGIEAHSDNPKYITPAALIWGFQDWVDYPASVKNIEQLWGDQQFLIFDETRENWYFRITREDLRRNHLSLLEFITPIHDALSKVSDVRSVKARRDSVASEFDNLRNEIAERVDDPKRLSDFLP